MSDYAAATEYRPVDVLSLSKDELIAFVVDTLGQPKFRGVQLYGWLQKGCRYEEMSNLPKSLRELLSERTVLRLPKVADKLVSQIDGTVKYLFELTDGECIESVVMHYEHGSTICISSQAGCKMGCRFCASTIAGFSRHLTPSEMLGQVLVANRELTEQGGRIGGIVMMGIGEPLDNFDNVVKFLRLVNAEDGLNIGYRHISLSTCGLVPRIRELAELDLPITLSISLHAPTDAARSALMPINDRYPVAELLAACKEYFDRTGRRISFEYALIAGENDSEADAHKLADVLIAHLTHDIPYHVNLIPVNAVKERAYQAASKEGAKRFMTALNKRGIEATIRRKLGADIDAACGQLRRNRQQEK